MLTGLPGPRLLVLGDMGEVGNQGAAFHAEAGALARSLGVDAVFTLGELSQAAGGRHFGDMESLQREVLAQVGQIGSVLVKGSRFMKMERVVAALADHAYKDKEKAHAV